MTTKRVFISFDFDHDEELRDALVAQAETPIRRFRSWTTRCGSRLKVNGAARSETGFEEPTSPLLSAGNIPIRRKEWQPN